MDNLMINSVSTIDNESIHPDFFASKTLIFDVCKLTCSKPEAEKESIEYGACTFKLNNFNIIFRVAKTTPTKSGLFVTVWKRPHNKTIEPFDISDSFDFFIIAVRQEKFFGIFVFPKSVLVKYNVISKNGKGGKRGIRVYPSWTKTNNKQAEKSQQWQVAHFIDIDKNGLFDHASMLRYFQ